MQDEFAPLVNEVTEKCRKYFGSGFCTAYLHGSIALSDAVTNISDLDYYLVVRDEPKIEDREYFKDLEAGLAEKHPVSQVHIDIHSLEEVKADKFARFILRYNSTLYSGEDIIKYLEENGCERLLPNAETAKGRLSFAKQCFSEALSGKQPSNTGDIPANVYFAARKFARYFVIIEGAYFLMTLGEFSSFKKEEVLKGLRKHTVGFDNILDITESVLDDPVKAGIMQKEYLTIIKPFMERILEDIEKC